MLTSVEVCALSIIIYIVFFHLLAYLWFTNSELITDIKRRTNYSHTDLCAPAAFFNIYDNTCTPRQHGILSDCADQIRSSQIIKSNKTFIFHKKRRTTPQLTICNHLMLALCLIPQPQSFNTGHTNSKYVRFNLGHFAVCYFCHTSPSPDSAFSPFCAKQQCTSKSPVSRMGTHAYFWIGSLPASSTLKHPFLSFYLTINIE